MTFYLTESEQPGIGLRRIALEQLNIVIKEIDDPDCSRDSVIHSLRSRCKKINAILELVEPALGIDCDRMKALTKQASRRLACLRDNAVSSQLAESDEPVVVSTQTDREKNRLLEESRKEIELLRQYVKRWARYRIDKHVILDGVHRTYRRVRRRWKVVRRSRTDNNFHRLRKWIKYLWYQVRILERSNKEKLRPIRKDLRRIGILLGEAHDLEVLGDRLKHKELKKSKHRHRMTILKEKKYRKALKRCDRVLWRKPSDFVVLIS